MWDLKRFSQAACFGVVLLEDYFHTTPPVGVV